MLFPVDDDDGDLLVHKHEDSGEERRPEGQERRPPGVRVEGVDDPAAAAPRRLESAGDLQLWGVNAWERVSGNVFWIGLGRRISFINGE